MDIDRSVLTLYRHDVLPTKSQVALLAYIFEKADADGTFSLSATAACLKLWNNLQRETHVNAMMRRFCAAGVIERVQPKIGPYPAVHRLVMERLK